MLIWKVRKLKGFRFKIDYQSYIKSINFPFCDKLLNPNKPKMVKIVYDEENNKKFEYIDFEGAKVFERKSYNEKMNEKAQSDNNIEGKLEGGINGSFDPINTKSLNNKNRGIFGRFSLGEGTKTKKQKKEKLKSNINHEDEEFKKAQDNEIKSNLFFSDSARIYIRAGDGGNGLFALNKGPMFDDSILN